MRLPYFNQSTNHHLEKKFPNNRQLWKFRMERNFCYSSHPDLNSSCIHEIYMQFIFNIDLVNLADWKNKSAEGSQATGTATTPRPWCLWQVCQHHWTQVSLAGQVPGEWTQSGETETSGEPLVQPHRPATPTQSGKAR